MEYLRIKVGDRVRRTQNPLTGEAMTYLGERMNDLYGILFRVVAVHLAGMVHLEVFEADDVLPQGYVIAVPDAYFTDLYWQVVPPLILKVACARVGYSSGNDSRKALPAKRNS